MNKFIAAGLIKEAGLRKEALKKSLPGWATKLFKRRRALARLADMTDAKATRQIADATQALGVDPLAAGDDLTKAIGDIQANAANLGKARARAVKLAELKDTLTHPVDYAVEQGKNVKRKLRDFGRSVKGKVSAKKTQIEDGIKARRAEKARKANLEADWEQQELSYTPNSGSVEGVSYNRPRLTHTPAAGSGGDYSFVPRPNKASNAIEPDAIIDADELRYPPVLRQSYPLVHTPASRYKRSAIDKLKRLAKLYAGKANRFAHNHPYRTIAGLYAADRLANAYMDRSTDDERDDTPSNSYYY